MTLILLAGCIGADDAPGGDDDANGEVSTQEGKGRLVGTVITVDLDFVEGAVVSLISAQNELVKETTTGSNGQYVLNNLDPDDYRLRVNAVCCREHIRVVIIDAEEVRADIRLDPFTATDLKQPYVVPKQWNGFVSCTLRWPNPTGHLPYTGLSACSLFDPSDDFSHVWEIESGLKTVVGAMTWSQPTAGLSEELTILMEVAGRWNQAPRYAAPAGPSPLEWRVDAGDVIANYENENIHRYDFENVEDSLNLGFRVFAAPGLNVVFQQQFSVYWDLYYWEPAPADASTLPDS